MLICRSPFGPLPGCILQADHNTTQAITADEVHVLVQRGSLQRRAVAVWPLRQLQRAVRRGERLARRRLRSRGQPGRPRRGVLQRHRAARGPAARLQPQRLQPARLGSGLVGPL